MADLGIADFKALEPKTNPCKNCSIYKMHGKKCWYHWEDKKECSQSSPLLE